MDQMISTAISDDDDDGGVDDDPRPLAETYLVFWTACATVAAAAGGMVGMEEMTAAVAVLMALAVDWTAVAATFGSTATAGDVG